MPGQAKKIQSFFPLDYGKWEHFGGFCKSIGFLEGSGPGFFLSEPCRPPAGGTGASAPAGPGSVAASKPVAQEPS